MSTQIINELAPAPPSSLNKELTQLKSKLAKLWGPLSLGIFRNSDEPKSTVLAKAKPDSSISLEELSTSKQTSPRSPLNKCEEELVCNLLVGTLTNLVSQHHKEFNPTAQASPFWLRKVPKGQLVDYLGYLNFTTLCSNFSVLTEAVRIFEIVCQKRPDIVHAQTVHRLLGACCLIVAKFYYDGYNSTHFGQILGVRPEKMEAMESFVFFEVLECRLNFLEKRQG